MLLWWILLRTRMEFQLWRCDAWNFAPYHINCRAFGGGATTTRTTQVCQATALSGAASPSCLLSRTCVARCESMRRKLCRQQNHSLNKLGKGATWGQDTLCPLHQVWDFWEPSACPCRAPIAVLHGLPYLIKARVSAHPHPWFYVILHLHLVLQASEFWIALSCQLDIQSSPTSTDALWLHSMYGWHCLHLLGERMNASCSQACMKASKCRVVSILWLLQDVFTEAMQIIIIYIIDCA